MANERLSLEIAAKAIGQESIDRLSESLNRFSVAAESSGDRAGRSFSGAGQAIGQHFVPPVAAASAAIREFEGNLPIRAVERFLTTTLGMGDALQKIFPIVGAIAFAGALVEAGNKVYELEQKWDPIVRAEKAAKDAVEEYGKSVDSVKAKVRELADAEYTRAFGKKAGLAHQADEIGRDAESLRRQAGFQHALVVSAQTELDTVKARFKKSPFMSPDVLKVPQAQLNEAQAKESKLQNDAQILESMAAAKRAEGLDAQTEENDQKADEAKRAAEEARRKQDEEDKRARSIVDSEREKSIVDPVERAKFAANARAMTFPGGANRDAVLRAGQADVGRADDERRDRHSKDQDEKETKSRRAQEDLFLRQNREKTRSLEDAIQEDKKTASFENDLTKQSASSAIHQATDRGASADKRIERDSSLSSAQKILALNQQDLATAAEKYQIERQATADLIDLTEKGTERAKAQHEADLKNADELQKIKEKNLDRLAELEDARIDQFRSVIGGLFEAVANRQPSAIPNFVKSQVLGQAQKLTENAAATYLWPTVSTIGKSAGLSGPLTAGTWLGGGGGKNDPLQKSASVYDTATDKFAAAVSNFAARAAGGSGNGSPGFSDGADGIPALPGGSSIPGGFGNAAAMMPSIASSLSTPTGLAKLFGGAFGSGAASVMSGYGLSVALDPGFNTATRVGAGVGLAGAAAAGGYGIYSGLKQGGVGGDLKAAGSAIGLGTTAAINIATALGDTLGSVVPIVGPLLAMALPLIGGLFNGPQKRANAIGQELSSAQYMAPTAINMTQSSSGTFTDFDAKGNIRTSNFSPYPQTTNPSLWQQTHGLFGPPPTWYDVPGGQTSQFGAPVAPVVQHIYQAGSIQTMDAGSFHDFAQKNSFAIGEAAGKNLQAVHGTLATEVDRRISR